MTIITSFCALCLLVVLGKYLRVKLKIFHRLYLPSSVIGGIIGLIFIQVLGNQLSPVWTAGWSSLPGLLINIVFASLFLGVSIPSFSTIWKISGPQLAYGQIVAWGQYIVGLGLVLVILGSAFDLPDIFGVVIPVGFEGGHGTAGGLRDTFIQISWPQGTDFCLSSATAGIISAVVVGMILINWAARRGHISSFIKKDFISQEERAGLYPIDSRPAAGFQTTVADSVDSLAIQLAIIGIAIFIGYNLKSILILVERHVPGLSGMMFFSGFPLFPLCMIGGLIVQMFVSRFSVISPIDHTLMQRLSGTALDFLVVAAISTIRIDSIANNITPFFIIIAGGILWNVFCVMWLARRLLPNYWFERAIAEMGQSMGVTATGLLLLRVVDPEQKTSVPSAFGYKQLLHEPFMGGGIWTSMAVLFVVRYGGLLVLGISVFAVLVWLTILWIFFLPSKSTV